MKKVLIAVVGIIIFHISFSQDILKGKRHSLTNSVKLNNLEILSNDFSNYYTWDSAKIICENLGRGWRLPNRQELNILFINRNKIGGFLKNTKYWSSDLYSKNGSLAYEQLFNFQGYKDVSPTYSKLKVRAVRNLSY